MLAKVYFLLLLCFVIIVQNSMKGYDDMGISLIKTPLYLYFLGLDMPIQKHKISSLFL